MTPNTEVQQPVSRVLSCILLANSRGTILTACSQVINTFLIRRLGIGASLFGSTSSALVKDVALVNGIFLVLRCVLLVLDVIPELDQMYQVAHQSHHRYRTRCSQLLLHPSARES